MSEYTCELELTIREQEARIAELEKELSRYKKSFKQFGWEDCGGEYLKPPVQNTEVIQNLMQELSRYSGAVEVEGYLDLGGELHIGRQESLKFKNIHGDVKVLVMKSEVK